MVGNILMDNGACLLPVMTLIIPALGEGQSQGEREQMSQRMNGREGKDTPSTHSLLSVRESVARIPAPSRASRVSSYRVLVDLVDERDPCTRKKGKKLCGCVFKEKGKDYVHLM